MSIVLRRLVSKKKKRYQDDDGFDLDLTYVTNKIIAMGFPSENYERLFRNPMPEVQRFLNTRHNDAYKLYNLCAERHYKKERFFGRVEESFSFYDHEAPKWSIVIPFCQDVHKWLNESERNIGVIHCKAGKGRTGVMICSYMLFSKHSPTASDALQFYANARTMNKKGVTIPSQQRYVRYLDRVLQLNKDLSWDGTYLTPHPEQTSLRIVSVSLRPAPLFKAKLSFQIYNSDFKVIYKYHEDRDKKEKNHGGVTYETTDASVDMDQCKSAVVHEDFKIMLLKQEGSKYKKLGQFWLNTQFIDDMSITIPKLELDKIYKDAKKNVKYPENFSVTVQFAPVSSSDVVSCTSFTTDNSTPLTHSASTSMMAFTPMDTVQEMEQQKHLEEPLMPSPQPDDELRSTSSQSLVE